MQNRGIKEENNERIFMEQNENQHLLGKIPLFSRGRTKKLYHCSC
jgi:hypothetical protein